MNPVDITVAVTFHREGLMAHRSLSTALESCLHVEAIAGVTTRLVATLDCADTETRRVVRQHPGLRKEDLVIELSHGDVALSRNHAIQSSPSGYVTVLDGDDHVSVNWLVAARQRLAEAHGKAVVHPQVVITFGATTGYREQIDQFATGLDVSSLLAVNFWNVCAFAERSTFLETPYVSTRSKCGGYGYEDWHWNCETIASGYQHLTAPRTVYFERRKSSGSLNRLHQSAGAVVRPSKLFRGQS